MSTEVLYRRPRENLQLTPAEYVIFAFGGVRKTAKIVGCTPGTVSKWQTKTRWRPNGEVPLEHMRVILQKAQEIGKDITETDLIWGREVPNYYLNEQKVTEEAADGSTGEVLP